MHMADALISPVVGGAMWAATAGVAAYSIKKVQNDLDEQKIPLMGVMGAFVFAAQMINFTIPGTGSSGHLGGGMLLAILLGPCAGFLTMASILVIQALFFADGGLLALGCNIFNLGFYTCFIAYPLIYKWIMRKGYSTGRIFTGMQPIHLAIGVVEGLVTAAVVGFVWKVRPEIIDKVALGEGLGGISIKRILAGLAIVAVITGGIFSWFASSYPDGLEWAMFNTSGKEELEAPEGIHQTLASIQERIAFLPDYTFKTQEQETNADGMEAEAAWPAVDAGTSAAGLVGGIMTLLLAGITGFSIHLIKKRNKASAV